MLQFDFGSGRLGGMSVAVLLLCACTTSDPDTAKGTATPSAGRIPAGTVSEQELRRLSICAAINDRLDILGVNTTGDPFRYPGYRNRELGDPNSPGTEINRLQMDYQRYRCYL